MRDLQQQSCSCRRRRNTPLLFYHNNDGDPLGTTISAIKDIYRQLPEDVEIVHSCSTGYGEALIKSALMLDEGEVETVAHYYAAAFLNLM